MTDLRQAMNAAIECNNIGVTLLKAGLLCESLDTFKAAAQLMYPISESFEHSLIQGGTIVISPALSPEPAACQNLKNQSEIMVKMAKSRTFLINESNGSKQVMSANFFVYADPFTIDLVQSTPSSCTVESAIIVYNMGLTNHLCGSLPCLEKALCLFDMAFSLAFSVEHDPRSPMIAMTSLNNAGQIHHSLSNYVISRQYLDTLSSYLLSLPSTSDAARIKERQYFLLNAMMLQEPKIAGAA
jgi:hypothetical protein